LSRRGTSEKARQQASNVATMLRAGSTARFRHQTDFYYRLGTSPWIKTVCEIGFNVGHSTAIWLSSNPLTTVYSFDLFESGYKPKLVEFLKKRFPGRLHAFKGDSTTVVPRTTLPECDLVHIDGRHSYWNVVVDFLNMRVKSRRDSIFIFDDQCDPKNCSSSSLVPAQPTLGTCDLVATKMLEVVTTFYASNRQFALYRRAREEGKMEQEDKLPCLPLCQLTFGSRALHARWMGHGEQRRQSLLQTKLRPTGCKYEGIVEAGILPGI